MTDTFRVASAADAGAIEQLLTLAGLPLQGVDPVRWYYLILEIDGECGGVAGLEVYGEQALLRSVAIHPLQRGQGRGRELCERMHAAARLAGANELFLLTMDAADYFVQRGFAVVDRTEVPAAIADCEEFRSMCPGTAVVMRIAL